VWVWIFSKSGIVVVVVVWMFECELYNCIILIDNIGDIRYKLLSTS
jgi:hypothetical protein